MLLGGEESLSRAPPGLSFWTLPAWSWDPKMRAGNLLAQPTGPNRTVPNDVNFMHVLRLLLRRPGIFSWRAEGSTQPTAHPQFAMDDALDGGDLELCNWQGSACVCR